jgi:leucyl aminopeptidase
MPVELLSRKSADALPVWFVPNNGKLDPDPGELARAWLGANGFSGKPGEFFLLPAADGRIAGAVVGTGAEEGGFTALAAGILGTRLPAGEWYFANRPKRADLACLGAMLGGYAFTRYGKKSTPPIKLSIPDGVDSHKVKLIADSVFLVRDLVNTPAADMGPSALENAVRRLAQDNNAPVSVVSGDDLIERNFPMIHAVGRAGEEAPRLLEFKWGRNDAPKITLVGKGVTFDTGGLDIKPPSSMLLMKKDMGGAANVLGLARMIMNSGLDVRLRVLIPAVENAVSGNSFRPGDILTSRAGLTVEVGNTDAEGRLVLADALTYAIEEDPDLLVDMATLTGAARVALGPDLAPFFTEDEDLAGAIAAAANECADPVWRMPMWSGYEPNLASKVADTNNVTGDSFAGAVTAALFLRKFAGKARSWVHFDILAWNPKKRLHGPIGGEAQAIRALFDCLIQRYSGK